MFSGKRCVPLLVNGNWYYLAFKTDAFWFLASFSLTQAIGKRRENMTWSFWESLWVILRQFLKKEIWLRDSLHQWLHGYTLLLTIVLRDILSLHSGNVFPWRFLGNWWTSFEEQLPFSPFLWSLQGSCQSMGFRNIFPVGLHLFVMINPYKKAKWTSMWSFKGHLIPIIQIQLPCDWLFGPKRILVSRCHMLHWAVPCKLGVY